MEPDEDEPPMEPDGDEPPIEPDEDEPPMGPGEDERIAAGESLVGDALPGSSQQDDEPLMEPDEDEPPMEPEEDEPPMGSGEDEPVAAGGSLVSDALSESGQQDDEQDVDQHGPAAAVEQVLVGALSEPDNGEALDFMFTTQEFKILKAWELCRHFGFDHEPIIEQVNGLSNVAPKIARVQNVYANGQLAYPDFETAKHYLAEYNITDMKPDSGVVELLPWTWDDLGRIGNVTVRRQPLRVGHDDPTVTIGELVYRKTLIPVPTNEVNARAKNFVLEYEVPGGEFSVRRAHAHLQSQVPQQNADFILGVLPTTNPESDSNHVLVMFRKHDTRRFALPRLFDCDPTLVYRVAAEGRMDSGMLNAIKSICSAFTFYAGTLYLHCHPECDYSIEQVIEGVKRMSRDSFMALKGSFLLVPERKRTDFQKSFLRASSILMSYVPAAMDARAESLVIDLLNLPDWVKSLSALTGLDDTIGERLLCASPATVQQYTLREVFLDPTLMQRFSIGLHGDNTTTGFGKTMTAILLASLYARSLQTAGLLSPRKHHVNFEADGILVWLLDEFEPGDRDQQQHMSEAMLKILLTPALQGTMRCKGTETLAVPSGLPRIFTSNSPHGDAWCGNRFEWSNPMQRKHIWFKVCQPLLTPEARAEPDDDGTADENSHRVGAAATALLADAGI